MLGPLNLLNYIYFYLCKKTDNFSKLSLYKIVHALTVTFPYVDPEGGPGGLDPPPCKITSAISFYSNNH